MKRVEGHNGLYRNEIGAIINTDDEAYRLYKQRKLKNQQKNDKIKSMEKDLLDTKIELEEIKDMLKKILKD